MKTRLVVLFAITVMALAPSAITQNGSNGIYVGPPKVYDDQALQTLLNGLRARLGQLTGLDQTSLTSRLGNMQGSSAQTMGLSLQAGTVPTPGVVSTNTAGGPGVTLVNGSGTSLVPGTGLTTTTNNQTTTATPSPTSTVQTTVPQNSATVPNLPSVTPFALPTSFSTSASDTLNEQTQLSYEIINLQLLLQGALDDEYIAGTTLRKRHTTIGFPLSIFTPPVDADGNRYQNAAAEVQVSVCDPALINKADPPSLMNILPKEKTYNVASIVNKSVSLGVGAVIGGIINVGGNFLWGHQTYYVVQAQDTVAAIRSPEPGVCEPFNKIDEKGKVIDSQPSTPATFAWQFRPVLGQKTIHQGLRQTFAQISFPVDKSIVNNLPSRIKVTTRWLEYDAKTGTTGAEIGAPVEYFDNLKAFPPGPSVDGLQVAINGDGSIGVTADGHFLPATRVRIGDSYLDDSTPGFQNDGIDSIRFTAPGVSIAQRGARIAASNGYEAEIGVKVPAGTARPPSPDTEIAPQVYSDALVELTVPVDDLPVSPEGGPYPIVVNVGSKTWGLPDAPFSRTDARSVSFLAPKDFIRVQDQLVAKRLFLPANYAATHPIKRSSGFSVTSVAILGVSKGKTEATGDPEKGGGDDTKKSGKKKEKTAPDVTHFAIVGSKLDSAHFLFPPAATKINLADGTYNEFDLSSDDVAGVKQFVLQTKDKTEAPVMVAVPEDKPDAKSADAKPHLDAHDSIAVGTGVAYVITGTMLDAVASIRYLEKQLPFSLALDKKSIVFVLPDAISSSAGIKRLYITFADGTSQSYQVTVGTLKAK